MIPSEHDPNSPLLLLNKHCQKRNWNLKVFPFWVKKKGTVPASSQMFIFINFVSDSAELFIFCVCLFIKKCFIIPLNIPMPSSSGIFRNGTRTWKMLHVF